jgi:hypothetical protein
MMRCQIQGLTFETSTPSLFRLAPEFTGDDVIDVGYLGCRGDWYLFHADPHGKVTTRCFANRDAAIGMIAQAFRNVGAL